MTLPSTKIQHFTSINQQTFSPENNPYNEYVKNALNPNKRFSINPDPSNNLNINNEMQSENISFTLSSFSNKNRNGRE